jgi:Bacterial regulatory proteins, luxR family
VADDAQAGLVEYLQSMKPPDRQRDVDIRLDRAFIRRYWFDALVVVAAGAAVLEFVVGRDSPDAPTIPLALTIAVSLIITLDLLARRQFPFGALAATAIVASAVSFIDGRLVPYSAAVFLTVIAASFLFGQLKDRRQAVAGLAITTAATAIVTRNDPEGALGDAIFTTLLFTVVWLAGFVFASKREREEAREAEERAARLELEREAEAQAAVAKELFVSETTVKTHVGRVLMKLGLRDRVQAVVFAYESGVVAPGV